MRLNSPATFGLIVRSSRATPVDALTAASEKPVRDGQCRAYDVDRDQCAGQDPIHFLIVAGASAVNVPFSAFPGRSHLAGDPIRVVRAR